MSLPKDWIPIDKWRWIRPLKEVLPGEQVYGMEVVGDSLIDEHIKSGDVLIFVFGHESKTDDDLCIVQTPFGVTAKYVTPSDGGSLLLRSANKKVKDQTWPRQDIRILGVVKRVERDM